MPLYDKQLTCTDCSSSFVFTAGEQEMQRVHGRSDEPSRCPTCYRRSGRRQGRRALSAPRSHQLRD